MSDSSNGQAPEIGDSVRICQIIAGALVLGVSSFVVIAVVSRAGKGVFAPQPWDVRPPGAMLTALGLAMAAAMLVVSFVVPRQMVAGMRKGAKDAGAVAAPMGLFAIYQTQMIVGLALLEGAAFFNVIAFMIEGRIPSLIAAAVLVLVMLARFPTIGGVTAWVEDQAALIREERNAA